MNTDHPDLAARVREAFDRGGYTAHAVTERLGTAEVPRPRPRFQSLPLYLWRTREGTPLDTLVRLFLIRQAVPVAVASPVLAPLPPEDWVNAGLLVSDGSEVRAVVEVVPHQGLILAADWPDATVADPVMGVADSTLALAKLTVRRRVQHALDLGAGCGLQTLLMAGHGDRVTATELNPRAVRLARFNAAVNGVGNVESLTGDWFAPVSGRTFDLIVCNPPFAIAPDRGPLHSQTGRPSDELFRHLVRTAPQHLTEGGYFQMVGSWVQTTGEDWRDRLAGWFAGCGCDAWVLHTDPEDATAYALQRAHDDGGTANETARRFDEWMAYAGRERIEAVCNGVVTLRRRSGRANWVRHDRLHKVPTDGGRFVEQGFALRDFLECDDRTLLAAKLRRAPHLHWERRHEASGTGWSAVESRLRLADGFGFVGNAEAGVAEFVGRCTGDRPLAAGLKDVAAAAGQPADRLAPAFLTVVRRLIELGYLLPPEVA